jgi:homoserine O-acetyltransferase
VIGGCLGSTGPSSINPNTSEPYRLDFPLVTIADMVDAQKRLCDTLGIRSILATAGGSMGGMQALQWAISYPTMVQSVLSIATTPRLSPQGIAFNEVMRKSIINDPKWNHGNYSNEDPPKEGMKLARAIGTITYLSDESMRNKFGRQLQNACDYSFSFEKEFQVESYLDHQGEKFTLRFDPNTYLYLCKAIDYFDLELAYGSLSNAFENVKAKFLVMAFQSYWLYPIYQSKQIVTALQHAGKDVTYTEIESNYGHDAFLLEYDKMAPILTSFLNFTLNHQKYFDGDVS